MPDMNLAFAQIAAVDGGNQFLGQRQRHIDTNLFVLVGTTDPYVQITLGRVRHQYASGKQHHQKRHSFSDDSHVGNPPLMGLRTEGEISSMLFGGWLVWDGHSCPSPLTLILILSGKPGGCPTLPPRNRGLPHPSLVEGWETANVSRWRFCFVCPKQRLDSRIERTSLQRPCCPPFKTRRVGQPSFFPLYFPRT